MLRSNIGLGVLLLASLGLAPAGSAQGNLFRPGTQNPGGQNPQGPSGQGQNSTSSGAGNGGSGTTTRPTTDPDFEGVTPVWTATPRRGRFQGFPIFPSGLPGVGSYPRTLSELGQMPIEKPTLVLTAPVPIVPGWPEWLRDENGAEIPYTPEHAVLVRSVDRVWVRPPEEDAFVPLYFYDKLRGLVSGSEIEVRHVGEFEVLLHTGGRLRADGPTALRVTELSDAKVELELANFTRLRIEPTAREHRLRLPDGSTVIVKPKPRPVIDTAAAAPLSAAGGLAALLGSAAGAPIQESIEPYESAMLVFERLDEPGHRSPRATLWNGGQLAVEWHRASGTTVIPGRHRVVFFLTPPASPIGAGLLTQQVNVVPDGATRRCEPVGDGQVTWSGTQFEVAAGSVLRLDPLLGDPFSPATVAAPAEGR